MREDIELLKSHVKGLSERLQNLRNTERLFLKAQGLSESMEKYNVKKVNTDIDIQKTKDDLAILQKEKADKVGASLKKIISRMNAVLTTGKAVLEIVDGKLKMGWKIQRTYKPYHGLSGGEQKIFDSALVWALDCNVLVQESAELDADAMAKSLTKLSKLKAQVIFNT